MAAAVGHPSLSPHDWLIIFVGLVVWSGIYYVTLRLWPYGPCLRCAAKAARRERRGGGGRNVGSNRKRWGTCGKCCGTGRRIRLGARIFKTVKEGR